MKQYLLASLLIAVNAAPLFAEDDAFRVRSPGSQLKRSSAPRAPAVEPAPGASGEVTENNQGMTLGTAPADDASAISEVVPTEDYLELVEIDQEDQHAIQWDPGSGRFLYISRNEPPFIWLTGIVEPGHEISWQDQWIPLGAEGRFQIKVNLPIEPKVFRMKVFTPERSFKLMRFINYWVKVPASMRLRIKEGDALVEKTLGFSSRYRSSSFVQLYSGARPVTLVDLDSLRHSTLTFRIFPPPMPEEGYDRWRITIRDAENHVIGEVTRLGAPPTFLDWRDVTTKLFHTGRFSYSIDLFRGPMAFEGAGNDFVAVEGLSMLDRPYLPPIQFEPREEIGYFAFRNRAGVSFSHFYASADLGMILWNRFIIRGVGLVSLHNTDPQINMTFTRLGAGFRLNGRGESPILGRPFLARVDVLLNHTAFTVHPTALVRRYSQVSLLVEPNLVLWGYHNVVPWFEFASKIDLSTQRLSFGLNYNIYVRPWSVRLGMGVAYDWLFRFPAAPSMEFSVFRTLLTFTAFL